MESSRYTIGDKIIGRGSFSEVHIGYDNITKMDVAIKKIKIINKNSMGKINEEIGIMKKLNHGNIVKCFDLIKSDIFWYIVIEYCNSGTLLDVVKYNRENGDMKKKEEVAKYYLIQLKNALEYINMFGYIHRDIKPHNALISGLVACSDYDISNGLIVKLADFGLARNYNPNTLLDTICGSPMYMAPEILHGNSYNDKTELWSFGVVMYELIFGNHPFQSSSIAELKTNIKQEIKIPPGPSYRCARLLSNLLAQDPFDRPTWDRFVNNSWFDDVPLSHDNLFNSFGSSSTTSLLSISPSPDDNDFKFLPKPISSSNLTKTILINKRPSV